MELLLGAGTRRNKVLTLEGLPPDWTDLVTLDFNADHKPDVVHDLNVFPWPFADNSFDEVHAYEVMEHLGSQGDFKRFFQDFSEIWRILKPGGVFAGILKAGEDRRDSLGRFYCGIDAQRFRAMLEAAEFTELDMRDSVGSGYDQVDTPWIIFAARKATT